MHIYLSTLTEVDYKQSLEQIESSYENNINKGKEKRELVSRLRQSPHYQYELEVIAKDEQVNVVGHIMLSKVEIVDESESFEALELISLTVSKTVRQEGIGKALVSAVEERAKSEGYITILVLDETGYFKQLGFELASEYDIFSEKSDADQLYVKFLWDQLSVYPYGKIKHADVI